MSDAAEAMGRILRSAETSEKLRTKSNGWGYVAHRRCPKCDGTGDVMREPG